MVALIGLYLLVIILAAILAVLLYPDNRCEREQQGYRCYGDKCECKEKK